MNIVIRERTIDDISEFCKFLIQLDNESKYMLYERGERDTSKETVQKSIKKSETRGDKCFIALDEEKIVGFVVAAKNKFIRTKHIAVIVVGVLEEYCDNGIGYSMFQHVIKWAKESKITKLELTVITENKRAIYLYSKLGFVTEGTRKMAMLIDGKYYDEYYMGKII